MNAIDPAIDTDPTPLATPAAAYGVKSFIIIFLKSIKNNINIKCDNKRPDPADIGPKYFEDVASVVNAGGPPDKVALVAVMHRYGLVPAAQK